MREHHPVLATIGIFVIGAAITWGAALAVVYSGSHHTQTTRLIPAAETLGTSTAASLCSTEGKYCNRALLQLINAERAQHGYQPLILSSIASYGTATCIGARGHAQHMAAAGVISHDQFPTDICLPYSTASEDVGAASGASKWSDIVTVFNLMDSEPWSPSCSGNHHCSLMSPQSTHIGIGFALGAGSWFTSEELTGP